MPKYLLKVSYTAEGVKGVLKDGGTKRRQAAEAAVKSTGGSLEAMYFAFGDDDVYCIVDSPDNASIAAASMAIGGQRARQAEDGRAADAGGDRSGGEEERELHAAGTIARSIRESVQEPILHPRRLAAMVELARQRVPVEARATPCARTRGGRPERARARTGLNRRPTPARPRGQTDLPDTWSVWRETWNRCGTRSRSRRPRRTRSPPARLRTAAAARARRDGVVRWQRHPREADARNRQGRGAVR